MKTMLLLLLMVSCASRGPANTNGQSSTAVIKSNDSIVREVVETTAGVIIGAGILSAGALK